VIETRVFPKPGFLKELHRKFLACIHLKGIKLKRNLEDLDGAWQRLNTELVGCQACPRLVQWREQVAQEKRRAYQEWEYWGRPVPGFGDPLARLLVVGLAPGAHGSNRTGRMFTGDSSGDTLYSALYRAGFASQPTSRQINDGLTLTDTFISAVARCAPPGNRPTPAELANCQTYLAREFDLMAQIRVIVALGQIAFEGCLRLLREAGYPAARLKFGHGLHYSFQNASSAPLHLIACYHPSRQNTQTGKLTPEMMDEVFGLARRLVA
jgi:uracil-DNA glycosylase family 4